MKSSIHSYNDYCSRCDNINKYTVNSVYDVPEIKCVILDFPLLQLLETINLTQRFKSLTLSSYAKCYYIFYLTFSFFPYINFKRQKGFTVKNYALKFIISNKKKLQEFVYNFFIHLASNLNTFNVSRSKNFDEKEIIFSQDKIITHNMSYKIPVFYLHDLNPYFSQLFFEINLKSLNIYINLKYTSVLKFNNNFKNMALFWI